MADEVQEILTRRGITDTRAVPPKLGIPLLEEAALENEPELQKLWSRLLANAMDPSFASEVRVAYTDIIKCLSGLDARILFLMYNSLRLADSLDFESAAINPFFQSRVCAKLAISEDEFLLSVDNLMRVQCVAPHVKPIRLGSGLQGQHLSSPTLGGLPHPGEVILTPLGIRFVEACTDGNELGEDSIETSYGFTQTIEVAIPTANW